MSTADTARRIVEQIPGGRLDPDLLHPEFSAWTAASGPIARERYVHSMAAFAGLFDPPLTMTVTGVTDGGDRVAIQAESHGTVRTGAVYANHYHFLLVFDEGRLREMHEYLNPEPLEAIRPLLQAALATGTT